MRTSLTERSDALEHIGRKSDVSVLIVGGGINGAGLFRELALQGIDVWLIDKSDFCAGASAAPSRMIHGGLRYLEFGEFRLVKESLRERNLLLQNAPHYVNPLPTTIPLFSWFSGSISSVRRFLHLGGTRPTRRGAMMVKAGLSFYDLFTRKHQRMPRHMFTSRGEALARRPLLHPGIIKTATYYDAWISYPERLCLELLLDGEEFCPEARAVNYVSLQGGSAEAATLRDELSGEVFDVRPKVLVNATGGWIDFANRALGHDTKLVGGTKGAHLVLDNQDLMDALQGEMVYYETPDGRVSIALPWLGKALIGSTDIRCGNPDDVRCEDEEIDYMLENVRGVFPELQVDRSHVVSFFSGVRPLRYSNASATVQASRDHLCSVIDPADELRFPIYSLVGGKWTTFRAFAQQVADRLLEHFGQTRRAGSQRLAIGGGKDFPKNGTAKRQWVAELQNRTPLGEERLRTLLDRYGTRAEPVADFIAEASDRPLGDHSGYSLREVEFVLRNEGVVHLDDLLLRRTAIALLGELTGDLFEELLSLMATLRGWSKEEAHVEGDRVRTILRERHGIQIPVSGGASEADGP